MHQFVKYAFLSVLVVCASIFSGCVSRKAGAGLGAVVLAGSLEVALNPAFELAYASNEFRVARHRWPRDYDELSSFLKQTDNRTYSSCQALKFHQINFTETADNNLRIDADYAFDSTREFNSGGTLSSNGTGRIDGLVISAFDPHEMRLPPNKPIQPTPR